MYVSVFLAHHGYPVNSHTPHHTGVGISGEEGLQAVRAADFGIAQFRYLVRLLLVHGRWDYKRVAKLVLYSFYKNMTFSLTLLWFNIFAAFSGQVRTVMSV